MQNERGFNRPRDLAVIRTPDGSATLDSRQLQEHYHSLFGAVTESLHVYISHGLAFVGKGELDILEVGLGTGLNALLTWCESRQKGLEVSYTALEPFPLPESLWRPLGHPEAIGRPELEEGYGAMMTAKADERILLSEHFAFRWLPMAVQELEEEQQYDLVFYDAFAPKAQPEMWTPEVFDRLHRAMRPGAALVTYCAEGDVRRAMMEAGLLVERLPGPPGKKQMLRASRPK